MKLIIDEGKILLVDGPASVVLLSGKINVLGAPLRIKENFELGFRPVRFPEVL